MKLFVNTVFKKQPLMEGNDVVFYNIFTEDAIGILDRLPVNGLYMLNNSIAVGKFNRIISGVDRQGDMIIVKVFKNINKQFDGDVIEGVVKEYTQFLQDSMEDFNTADTTLKLYKHGIISVPKVPSHIDEILISGDEKTDTSCYIYVLDKEGYDIISDRKWLKETFNTKNLKCTKVYSFAHKKSIGAVYKGIGNINYKRIGLVAELINSRIRYMIDTKNIITEIGVEDL